MANPYQPPAPVDVVASPQPPEPRRYFRARLGASIVLLAIWTMGATILGTSDDDGAWPRLMAGPF